MSKFPTSPRFGAPARTRHGVAAGYARFQRQTCAGLTPQLAQMYARTGPRTLARDLNRLQGAGLIEVDRSGVRPRIDLMSAFLLPTSH